MYKSLKSAADEYVECGDQFHTSEYNILGRWAVRW